MNVGKIVEKAWSKTVQDFEEAKENGDAWIWTEDTLRLYFFRHFCKQDVKVTRVLSEVEFSLGEYGSRRPDLVLSVESDDGWADVAFEFKYFGKDWQKAWEDLKRYAVIGWNYGYFLAIGRPQDCDRIPRKTQKIDRSTFSGLGTYEVRAMTHKVSYLEFAPDFKIAEDLAKETLKGAAYLVNEYFGAVALLRQKGYAVCFDMAQKEDKCVVYVGLYEDAKELWNERKLKEMGYDRWSSFGRDGLIKPSKSFTGYILIGEFEPTSYPENVNRVKASLDQFREKIEKLRH